ncbi:MAG TPA: Na+/H+ antiporter subunit E [Staphylococcus sp.]|uniref:Na+/H+ antiporter subunit E n=2 Tax=Mammaliicoccus vitulinus TaxID=71237 RepID=A0A2T4PRB1_9STAP|nr:MULTISPECIES: Na+/H+ antiporter subunit E [Mammaliicoccus]HAL08659.1 Na+/H+ antiporter subunit E [Staphylococcus sp.]MBM6629693.1 Na+/H+ antiporter subunit E [Mammaliicoccus vitulinus]MBO3077719.1 Na+/H+ antiporter subunit E [Mammaliicoccus vitulinus]MEB7657346.1 Na+/H+ antiporter subunit E [Mammaliicoccus vitulinus]PNZ39826.1 Na+/H+ antiporter subunit E [Mammaliicoccus vitulinus]
MAQLLLNILIAFLWTLFQDEDKFHLSTFIGGYFIGIFIVYLMHRFFGHVFYLKKVWIIFKFICVYNYQLVTSSMTTINYILFKTNKVNPGLVTYETSLRQDWAITLLTLLIMLTPGSVVLRLSPDGTRFFIHAIDISEREKQILTKQIKKYEKLIWEVLK